jgi:hypothetical protein
MHAPDARSRAKLPEAVLPSIREGSLFVKHLAIVSIYEYTDIAVSSDSCQGAYKHIRYLRLECRATALKLPVSHLLRPGVDRAVTSACFYAS